VPLLELTSMEPSLLALRDARHHVPLLELTPMEPSLLELRDDRHHVPLPELTPMEPLLLPFHRVESLQLLPRPSRSRRLLQLHLF
jgi:hypothetical protein